MANIQEHKESNLPVILAIDDTPVMLSMFSAQFNSIEELKKYRLVTCFKTDDAFESLILEKVQLILLDWNLRDDMSGFDFLQRLHSMEVWRNIPVIMVTAEGRKEKIMEAIKAGAKDYLVKPVDKKNLIQKVQLHMEKKQPKAA